MAANDATILRGGNGGHFLNLGEGTVTGSFGEIVCLTTTVIDAITNPLLTNISDIEGVSLPAGTRIGGLTTSILLTSGEAIAYV
jgi:hypothetical protein